MSTPDSSTSDAFLYAYVRTLDAYAAAESAGVPFDQVRLLRRRPEVVDALNDRLAELEELAGVLRGGRVLGLMAARAVRSADLRDLLGQAESDQGLDRLRELLTSVGVGGDTWGEEVSDADS